jgi:hypothetical protein
LFQSLAHFLRHANGLLQAAQSFDGKSAFFTIFDIHIIQIIAPRAAAYHIYRTLDLFDNLESNQLLRSSCKVITPIMSFGGSVGCWGQ